MIGNSTISQSLATDPLQTFKLYVINRTNFVNLCQAIIALQVTVLCHVSVNLKNLVCICSQSVIKVILAANSSREACTEDAVGQCAAIALFVRLVCVDEEPRPRLVAGRAFNVFIQVIRNQIRWQHMCGVEFRSKQIIACETARVSWLGIILNLGLTKVELYVQAVK